MNTLGVIITYNPDVNLLIDNIKAVRNQISKLIIYDNASENIKDIKNTVGLIDGLELVENNTNIGLPINYNRAAKRANELGCEWLLILDQDTVLPSNYINKAKKYTAIDDVAIMCPVYKDVNINQDKILSDINGLEVSDVDLCISSGSLCRVNRITELGGFDEQMFIDYVDYDYCKTVKENGYRIIQLNDCVMEHMIGKAEIVRLFGRPQIIYNHSPFRKYYFFRNKLYYARKHGLSLMKNKGFYIQYAINIVLILYESNKTKKFLAALRGIRDGMRMDVNK